MFLLVTQTKGGVGKSTIAAHMAVIGHDRGYRVAVIDADSNQGHAAKSVHRIAPDIERSLVSTVDEARLVARHFKDRFDLIVIDTPGHDATPEVTSTLTMYADVAIVPCGPSDLDIAELKNAYQFIYLAQEIRNAPDAYVVWTKTAENDRVANAKTPKLIDNGLAVAQTRLAALNLVRDSGLKFAVTRLATRQQRKNAVAVSEQLTRITPHEARRAASMYEDLFDELVTPSLVSGGSKKPMERVANA